MYKNRGGNSSSTEFPSPTDEQRRKRPEYFIRRDMEYCVRHAEQYACQQIRKTQISQARLEMTQKVGMDTHAKDHLLCNGRDQQQDKQTANRTRIGFKSILCSLQEVGSKRPTDHAQAVRHPLVNSGWGKSRAHFLLGVSVVFSALLLAMDPARAALGEVESTTQGDSMRMAARRHLEIRPAYSVYNLAMRDGSLVREFVSSDGIIFGVSWRTQYKPNLEKLLGASYSGYVKSARDNSGQVGIRRNFRHSSSDLVVKSDAHLHLFSGWAYRRSLLPPDFSPDQIE